MTEIKADFDLVGMARKIDRIEQAVLGNGVPGLCQRVSDLEKSDKASYRITGIFAGIGVVAGSIITFLIQIFRG
ncbi:MAG: hypothetical protein WCY19_04935 [Candidatus Gastranaerophilaceae bacterium]